MWKCIPVTLVACATIVAIPHINTFIKNHPLPGCATITQCHFVWQPDTADSVPLTPTSRLYDWPETYVPPPMVTPVYIPPHYKVKKEKEKDKHHEKQNVPEPTSATLMLIGCVGLLVLRRISRRTQSP